MLKAMVLTGLGSVASIALANPTDDLLASYATEAKAENASFDAFSVERGRSLYVTTRPGKDGDVACATCHMNDPRKPGMTRTKKVIEPLAPAVNPARFTDREKVEKWFRRNCRDVFSRVCSATEKGDFITYLRSVK